MKAVLVIDKPTSCSMCKANRICKVWLESNSLSPTWKGFDDILDGCPLRPLPREFVYQDGDYPLNDMFAQGWDACLEKITGETE